MIIIDICINIYNNMNIYTINIYRYINIYTLNVPDPADVIAGPR